MMSRSIDRRYALIAVAAAMAAAGPAWAQDAAKDQKAGTTVDTIVVTGRHKTTTATKTDTPLLETPQAITVIPRQLLELRDVRGMRDALQLTAGVQTDQAGSDTRYEEVAVRGFSATQFGDYRDGLRQPSYESILFHNEPYGLESIEVLKGPSSVLFGQNAPGGLINVQSKLASDVPVDEVIAEFGSFDLKQIKYDLGMSLDGGAVDVRLVGLDRDAKTFLTGYAPNDRIYLEPSVRIKFSDRTTLTVYGEYLQDHDVAQFSTFQLPDGKVTDVRTYDPNFDRFEPTQEQIGYAFEHDFSDVLKFKQNLRYAYQDLDYETVGAYGLAPDNRTIERLDYRVTGTENTFAIDNQLQAHFNLGPVETRLLGGVDYLELRGQQNLYYGFTAPNLDLYDPVYGAVPIATPPLFYDEHEKDWQVGGYFQGQFKYDGWILTAGGREDHAESAASIVGPAQLQKDSAFTYRVALAKEFSNGLAPYISYGTSFQLTPGTTFAGEAFRPSTGKQIEGGVKYSPQGVPGFVTATAFQIDQQNVLTNDTVNAGFYVQTGAIRSRGVELEGVLRPIPGLNLQASYTYLDMTVTGTTIPIELGKTPPVTPKNMANALADYTFKSGLLSGFGLGGDVRFEGRSWQDEANTQRNPAFTYLDAFAHYDIGHIRLGLRADNLLDNRDPICSLGYCYPQMPRDVIGSIRYRF